MNEKPVGRKFMQRIRVLKKNEFGFLKIKITTRNSFQNCISEILVKCFLNSSTEPLRNMLTHIRLTSTLR